MSRVVVISGAGAGLGRALARRFIAAGDQTVLLGRTLEKIERVAVELGPLATALQCDVTSPDSVRDAFVKLSETYGHIDILISNAATYEPFHVVDATDQQILEPALTNFVGPILMARAAIPMIVPGGQIINISSESVVLEYPMLSLYQSSKAGLERFSQSLAKELKGQGIRVTALRAGAMYDEDSKAPEHWDPSAARTFSELCAQTGIDLRGRPTTHFRSAAEVVFGLTNLPADVTVPIIQLDGFRS